jgi:predicted DNA-binding antitoxin AbrB/MazE fold protein
MQPHESGEKMKVDMIYERGVFKIVSPAEIDTDEITVHIINRDEILTETDMRDILDAIVSREKGDYYKYERLCHNWFSALSSIHMSNLFFCAPA